MRYAEFNESRKNPPLNPKLTSENELNAIAQQYGTDNMYVTFSNVNKLGVNPNHEYTTTPLGIYAYPLEYILQLGWNHIPYAANRPYITVFKDTANLKQKFVIDYNSDYDDILDFSFRCEGPLRELLLKKYNRELSEYIEWDLDLEGYDETEQANIMYKLLITRNMTEISSPVDDDNDDIKKLFLTPSDQTYILRKAGYTSLIDSTGAIHSNESHQAVFFDVSKLKVIKQIQNRVERSDHDDFVPFDQAEVDDPLAIHDPSKALVAARMFYPNNQERYTPAILKTPLTAFKYATYVLKNKWPEGEKVIQKNPDLWQQYQDLF